MAYSDLPESVRAEYERIGREREAESRETDRLYRWELFRVCAELIGWTVLGLVVAGFGFATTDVGLGRILLYGGMVLSYAGIATSLWMAHQRGQERGDW